MSTYRAEFVDHYFFGHPRGWRCTRASLHTGPCALVPRWWNIPARIRFR